MSDTVTYQDADRAGADAFAGRLLGMINDACLALMVSIGHRTGLFDTMGRLDAGTSVDIAREANLNERYVREWLGAMVVGGIVEHDPASNTYWLPPEHAAMLTRAYPTDNMAVYAQYIGVLGAVEDRIVECFRNGGGVPYSEYTRFHEVMAEDSSQTVVAALTDRILPLAPGLAERLEAGIDVLDLGCGRGLAAMHMAELFPKSRFRGIDFSEEAISFANRSAAERGVTNVRFDVVEASALADTEAYDLVTTFDAVHDQADPARVLANIHRALRPGGTYLMQDIQASSHVHGNLQHPLGPTIYTISCMHCMSVSLAQGGHGLGAAWGKELALKMLAEAGFRDVRVEEADYDPFNSFYIMQK